MIDMGDDGMPDRSCLAALPAGRSFMAAVVVALAVGCDGGAAGTSVGSVFPVRFQVVNDLAAPVTIAIDDSTMAIVTAGKSTDMTVSSAAQWLTWTSAKATDSTATPIPDDVGQVKILVGGIRSPLEITNIIDDQPFVTANVYNDTDARVSIGVFNGTSVACVSVLRAASGTASGFTKIGYYRLLPVTEIRAYRDGSTCTGPYVSWPWSQLAAYVPKSGLITLRLTSPP